MNRRINIMLEILTPETWDWIDMEVNSARITMATQKVKNKAITRGGIYYHHWGGDHQTMQIQGTVGQNGLKGLEKIERMLHIVTPDGTWKPQVITAYIEDRVYDCHLNSFSYQRNGDLPLMDYNIQMTVVKEHEIKEA